MDWCIYVGASASVNLKLGLEHGIWGHKEIFKSNQLKEIKIGDRLFFVYHLQQLREAKDPNQSGFPRVSIENLYGVINSLIECSVVSNYYYDDNPLWPDDIYPHRFKINVVKRIPTLHFGLEFFSNEFVSSVQKSLLRKGLPYSFNADSLNDIYSTVDLNDADASEGAPIYSTHKRRERNRKIVELKKQATLSAGRSLQCLACGFDFAETYGEHGVDFIECHHLNPLADTELNQTTKLDDLVLVCSNCHKMIHRHKPWLKFEELKEIISSQSVLSE